MLKLHFITTFALLVRNRSYDYTVSNILLNQLASSSSTMIHTPVRNIGAHGSPLFMAAPKKGTIVDTYQTVSVTCSKCRTRLFRYKKKNGTKSNLIKCYIERICDDPEGLLDQLEKNPNGDSHKWDCPNCQTSFARTSMIHGRPALKLIGGKVRMMKK